MKLVEKPSEIWENINTLDSYLKGDDEECYSFAINLIKRGMCFIAVKARDGYLFYPSRFIGYVGNTMSRHNSYTEKDGRDTNRAIEKALKQKNQINDALEEAYLKYCESLHVAPDHKDRSYWEWPEEK